MPAENLINHHRHVLGMANNKEPQTKPILPTHPVCDPIILDGAIGLRIDAVIFPPDLVKQAAARFTRHHHVMITGDPAKILKVEIRPKNVLPGVSRSNALKAIARDFNRVLVLLATGDLDVIGRHPELANRVRNTINDFLLSKKPNMSRTGVIASVGLALALGITGCSANASHSCGGGGGDGGGCFTGDQFVATPKGERMIASLDVGDTVVSFDHETRTFTTSVIDRIISHDGHDAKGADFGKDPLVRLTVGSGDNRVISHVTLNHPYFDPIAGKYKQLRKHQDGDTLLTRSGELPIISRETLIDGDSGKSAKETVVYNLWLKDGPASFLVDGIVVHNNGCPGGGGGSDGDSGEVGK